MAHAQLKPLDAAYLFESRRGPHLDRVGFWVFDTGSGTPPTRTQVAAHLRDRSKFIETLNRRIVDVPFNLDYPYWVVGGPLAEQVSHDDRVGLEWNDFLATIGDLAAMQMDPATHAWRIHVFYQVRNAPGTTGPATIVVLQGSHALVGGPSIAAVAFALFGDPKEPLTVPGIEPAGTQVNRFVAAVRGAARTPSAIVRYLRMVRSAQRDAARDQQTPVVRRTATIVNSGAGNRRTARVLRLDVDSLKRKDLTLTAVLLTVVSRALQDFLDECDGGHPGDLAAMVTIALTAAPESLGVNRIGGAVVDLHPSIGNLAERAAAIQESLNQGIERGSGERAVENLKLANAIPSVMYPLVSNQIRKKAGAARSRGEVHLHTVVSSINFGGPMPLELLGSPLAFSAAYPPLTAEAGLTHGLIGAGPQSSLSILAAPATVPDIDRYVRCLEAALAEIAAELPPR
ncbi:MAG: wax ester/triacylglycerol synthase domain-containing protein [Rhodococcus sp. (in: high G+C Gram-positive bacteria)]|uniref:wax ester/triacylglycerol synthase domain-containing protein n=1 Tax=Rhodococcus sp. TaxID=1831 RepID=UPI003BB6D8E0